jgi:arginase family enzyme
MSFLRAKCPTCRTLTAVAIGPDYECHSCGRTFAAGLVRVPRAWGDGGEGMVTAAALPLDYPETGVIDEDSLHAQTLALASDLPVRPLVLGGCCCSHIGAVEGLAARHDRLGVIWFDSHGDLNTPETSPSGNEWGMPLRMIIDGGAVDPTDVLDPGELAVYMPEPGGPTLHELEERLARIRERGTVLGAGISGLAPGAEVEKLERLTAALGL